MTLHGQGWQLAPASWFARTVIAVRQGYELTIDQLEVKALETVLEGCE